MSNQNENIDEVDLKDILLVLNERKKSIIYGVLIGTALLISVLFFMPKTYQSDAVLSLNSIVDTSMGISIPTFRSFDNVYSNTNLFVDYINSVDSNSDWHIGNEFIINSAIPIYAYEEKSVISIDKNTVLGLKLTCQASTPQKARDKVEMLGNYIKTVMLNIQVWDYFDVAQAMSSTALAKNNSLILQFKFGIENLQERSEMLESKFLASEAIKFTTFETQIIQVDEVTEKYLSPQQQLLSVKVSIKNSEIEVKSLEREIRKNQVMLDYFSRIEGYFDRGKQFLFNAELLDEITAELERFFLDYKNNDAADEAYYMIMEHFNEFFNMQHAQYKFISGPTMSKEWVKPKILITSVIGLLFFILFFSFRALLIEWWKSN